MTVVAGAMLVLIQVKVFHAVALAARQALVSPRTQHQRIVVKVLEGEEVKAPLARAKRARNTHLS